LESSSIPPDGIRQVIELLEEFKSRATLVL
jgi:hypothetical protein